MDDILITGNKIKMDHVKSHLDKCFGIKDLGPLYYFLGIEVTHLPEGIVLSQKKFIHELLQTIDISGMKPVATRLPINCKLTAEDGASIPDPTLYRILMGKLNFLSNTRPDLSFAVQY